MTQGFGPLVVDPVTLQYTEGSTGPDDGPCQPWGSYPADVRESTEYFQKLPRNTGDNVNLC